jgi:hypothetical protein
MGLQIGLLNSLPSSFPIQCRNTRRITWGMGKTCNGILENWIFGKRAKASEASSESFFEQSVRPDL